MFRIKELRLRKGINMKEAAKLLDMPYTTYVNYEKGLREPTSEVLIQLADFYDTSVDYIVGRSASNAKSISVTKESSNIIRLAGRDGSYEERTLSDEQLAMLKSLIGQLPEAPDDL